MNSLRYVIYWYMYMSSITGLHECTGVIAISDDSVYTYIAPYQYTGFAIQHIEEHKDNIKLIATRPYCTLILIITTSEITQELTIKHETLSYREHAVMRRKRYTKTNH